MHYLNRQYTIKLITMIVLYLCVMIVVALIDSNGSNASDFKEKKEKLIEKEDIEHNMPNAILAQYNELIDRNKDVIGMIHIPGSEQDYPVMLGNDNSYYLTHNERKEKTEEGIICADYAYRDTQIRQEFLRHTLLYGRNCKNGSMFGAIDSYKKKKFFKKHPYIEFDNLTEKGKWKVFSVYVLDAEQESILRNFQNDTEFMEYLNVIKRRSKYAVDVDLTKEDKILTLCTSSNESGNTRLVVHAVLVK